MRFMIIAPNPAIDEHRQTFRRNMCVHLPLSANLNKYTTIPSSITLHNPFCMLCSRKPKLLHPTRPSHLRNILNTEQKPDDSISDDFCDLF